MCLPTTKNNLPCHILFVFNIDFSFVILILFVWRVYFKLIFSSTSINFVCFASFLSFTFTDDVNHVWVFCLSACFLLFVLVFATEVCSLYCTSEQHASSHTWESWSLLLCLFFFSSFFFFLAFVSLLFFFSFAKKKPSIKAYKMVTRNDCFQ